MVPSVRASSLARARRSGKEALLKVDRQLTCEAAGWGW
jgi:hypothetical protein